MRGLSALVLSCSAVMALAPVAVSGEKASWDFSGVTEISIDGLSGDVVILPTEGKKTVMKLRADVRPGEAFEPVVKSDGNAVIIKERWSYGRSSGGVLWTIYVPQDGDTPRIRVSSSSGGLQCTGVAANILFKSSSGDVELLDVGLEKGSTFTTSSGSVTIRRMPVGGNSRFGTSSGGLELKDATIEGGSSFSTSSGDISIEKCRIEGDVSFSSSSGDVEMRNTQLLGESSFSSSSGNVFIHLTRLPEKELSASSASGRVTLDVNDFGEDFTLVMIKRKDRGRISCPFAYTGEKEFKKAFSRDLYVKKIVKRGSGEPEITLQTASGKVVVRTGR